MHIEDWRWYKVAWNFTVSSVQLLSCVRLFATPWTAARQASLSITNSWSSPRLMCIESVMPSSHLILCHPLLLLPPLLPSIRVFSSESTLLRRWNFTVATLISYNFYGINTHVLALACLPTLSHNTFYLTYILAIFTILFLRYAKPVLTQGNLCHSLCLECSSHSCPHGTQFSSNFTYYFM